MSIKKSDAASVLGINVKDIDELCNRINSDVISKDDYKLLVDLYTGDNPNELYDKGDDIFYDASLDDELAIPILTKAADKGSINAMLLLAEAYFKGYGVEPDEDKAIDYLNECLHYDYMPAYYFAGILLNEGKYLE